MANIEILDRIDALIDRVATRRLRFEAFESELESYLSALEAVPRDTIARARALCVALVSAELHDDDATATQDQEAVLAELRRLAEDMRRRS